MLHLNQAVGWADIRIALRSLDKTGIYPHITQLQIKLASPGILQRQSILNIEVRVTVRIDDAEVTSFERYQKKSTMSSTGPLNKSLRTCVIDFNIE
jgi:hypothetical protein